MSQARTPARRVPQRGSPQHASLWPTIGVCAFLFLGVFVVYDQTLSQGFLNYDDGAFVNQEPRIFHGFTWPGIVWAFTSGPKGDWCPLTMLSHMLDCQLYGATDAAGHHATNVLLHAASAVALFLVLRGMTGTFWPSAMVAALFAFHPLRVESVAWIAERRDVLSGLFFMLTLGAYTWYVRRPSLPRYLAVAGLFTLALMSKAIVVTLPALLLLLDFWPLGRFGHARPDAPAFSWRLVWEKVPLLALALATAGIALLTHGGPSGNPITPWADRFAGAAVSSVAYIGQMFVPLGLSPFYGHPEAGWPLWQVASAAALLLAITAAVIIGRRAWPFCFVGWFWYVGMLLPVIELIPAGGHARADRYTYLAQIGLYIALVWAAARLGESWQSRRVLAGVSAAIVAALMVCTWRQTGFWHDSQSLWRHAVDCDPKNVTARYFLGATLEEKDQPAAIAQYQQALRLEPGEQNIYGPIRAQVQNRLGLIAAKEGDTATARADFERALEWDPRAASAYDNLGGLLVKSGDLAGAIEQFRLSVKTRPDLPMGYFELALALAQTSQTDEAIADFEKAIAIDPNFAKAHVALATVLAGRQQTDAAIAHYRRALAIDPSLTSAKRGLQQLLKQ